LRSSRISGPLDRVSLLYVHSRPAEQRKATSGVEEKGLAEAAEVERPGTKLLDNGTLFARSIKLRLQEDRDKAGTGGRDHCCSNER
jgi:hypothetical protein